LKKLLLLFYIGLLICSLKTEANLSSYRETFTLPNSQVKKNSSNSHNFFNVNLNPITELTEEESSDIKSEPGIKKKKNKKIAFTSKITLPAPITLIYIPCNSYKHPRYLKLRRLRH